ncbi:MAG: GNVR domain-containing protein [bacterium]
MKEISVSDYIRIIIKRWKLLAAIFFAATATTAAVSLSMPRIYQAKLTMFVGGGPITYVPPALTAGPISMLMKITGFSTGNFNYVVSLLKSDTAKFRLSEKLDLPGDPDFNPEGRKFSPYDLLEKLNKAIYVDAKELGMAAIYVESTSPRLAAEMANALPAVLDELIISTERKNRIFIEEQLKNNVREIGGLEARIKAFQEKHGIVVLDEQARKQVELQARLNAELIHTDIALEASRTLRETAGSLDKMDGLIDEMTNLETRKTLLERELGELGGEFEEYPDVMLEYARIKRDMMIKEAIYATLSQAYQEALVNEQAEEKKFQIIDRAAVPERHIKPHRRMNVMISAMASLFVGTILIFFLEFIESVRKPEPGAVNAGAEEDAPGG